MTRTRKPILVVLIAISSACAIWFFANNRQQIPPKETSQAEPCDSCSARHKNLTRLRDARGPTVIIDE